MKNYLAQANLGTVTPPSASFWGSADESSIFGIGPLTQNIITSVYSIAGLLLLAYLLYGSIKWLMSAGDAKNVQGAKDTVMNAIIGIILLVASVFIVEIASGVLGIGSPFNLVIPTLLP